MVTRRADHRPLLMRIIAKMAEPDLLVEEYVYPGKGEGPVHGLWEARGKRERITINPMPWVVQTLIHECLHSLFPDWSESYVENRTKFIFNRMSDEEVIELYRLYQERVIGRKS